MTERAIRSVCVLGDGVFGLSAAAAFARALPGVRVSIVSAPADPGALAERLPATLPSVHRFHAAIGLDEMSLVRSGAATHLLGVRFDNWPGSAEPWFHGFGEHGLKAGDIPFHTLWHRARAAGQAAPFHRYGAAAVLAAVRRLKPCYELMTVYRGQNVPQPDAEKLGEALRSELNGVEIELVDGGQPHYDFLISAE